MAIYKRLKKDGKTASYTVVPENGKDFTTGKRNRKGSKSFSTRKEAEAYENKLKVKREMGISTTTYKTTVAEAAQSWLIIKKDDLRDNGTYYSYEVKVLNYIIPYMGQAQISNIRTPFLQKYLSSLRQEDDQPFSKSTLSLHRIVLQGIFRQAVQEGIIQYNPAIELTIPKNVAPEKQIKLLCHEDIIRFLEIVKTKPIYTLAVLLLFHGFRLGEVCGFRWKDVDLKKETITVAQQRTTLKGRAIEGDPKTETSRRTHKLTPYSKAALLNELERQKRNRDILGEKYHDLGYIIAKIDGQPYNPNSRTKEFKKICMKYELPHVYSHLLRHQFASVHDDLGTDTHTIMEAMGHSNEKVTEKYIQKIRASKVISESHMDEWLET